MLRLFLLRHSKAVAQAAGGDLQRMLNQRGKTDALRIGEYLRAENLVPELALTSPARRAKETLEMALSGPAREVTVAINKNLYLAEPHTLLRIVKETPAHVRALLVVGHNPGLAAFAVELARYGDPRGLTAMDASFPTSALAVIDFERPAWAQVDFDSGQLDRFVTPASLDGGEEG